MLNPQTDSKQSRVNVSLLVSEQLLQSVALWLKDQVLLFVSPLTGNQLFHVSEKLKLDNDTGYVFMWESQFLSEPLLARFT